MRRGVWENIHGFRGIASALRAATAFTQTPAASDHPDVQFVIDPARSTLRAMPTAIRELEGLRTTIDRVVFMPDLDAPDDRPFPFEIGRAHV